MELIVGAKVRPKIIPIANNIYNRVGAYPTVDELNQHAQKFMSKNHSRFVCDIENCMDLQQKGQIIVAKSFNSGDVDVTSVNVSSFKHTWENNELSLMFKILFQPKSDNLELQLEQLHHYIFKWMQVEGAYIRLGTNEYWGENGVMCSFRVEIEESDVDVATFTSEE